MAQYRQPGADRFVGRPTHDVYGAGNGGGGVEGGNGGSDHIAVRIPHKQGRIRRKALKRAPLPAVAAVVLVLGLLVTLCAYHYLSPDDGEIHRRFDDQEEDDDELKQKIQADFQLGLNSSRVLKFGRGSITGGRDSRYWDRDDRRRDDEYDEGELDESLDTDDEKNQPEDGRIQLGKANSKILQDKFGEEGQARGLYNEAGRGELKKFEKEYKESLKNKALFQEHTNGEEDVNSNDEYDDGIDIEDGVMNSFDDQERSDVEHQILIGGKQNSQLHDENANNERSSHVILVKKGSTEVSKKSSVDTKKGHGHTSGRTSASKYKPSIKVKTRRRSSCDMKLMNSTQLLEPLENKKFSRFSLQYTEIENLPVGVDNWEPRFAGHQTLQEREESFYARDQKINCGFVKGPIGSPSTGFDLAEDDMRFMSSCHIAVSSCIFGNSDHLRAPYNKMITRSSRKNVCFVMFMDESTLQTLSSEGQKPDAMGFIGLWKVVVVKNLPYSDMRRVGKIPKFLTHRLFPSARYSIWLDSKLRLQSDPLLILEYFLWRRGHEYAISNHYDRHCVWEEVLQNKKLNKFNHTIIDQQFAFYQADGLKRFDPSDPDRLLPSYVPEGSFIMRAHTPMSNLFSCLWFNEVDRFTPRDQLSFAYTYLKMRRMNPGKPFHLNMFKDCERRAIAKLFRHRAENKRNVPMQTVG